MKYKTPDIKTADVFFEIMSNPKKTLEHIKAMRDIRDEIAEDLGLIDTKAKADKLFREASAKMTEALDIARGSQADIEASSSRLVMDIEDHKIAMKKDCEAAEEAKKSLASDKGQFTKTSTALKTDLEKKLADVKGREAVVLGRENAVADRENAVNAVAEQMGDVKETMARIRPV